MRFWWSTPSSFLWLLFLDLSIVSLILDVQILFLCHFFIRGSILVSLVINWFIIGISKVRFLASKIRLLVSKIRNIIREKALVVISRIIYTLLFDWGASVYGIISMLQWSDICKSWIAVLVSSAVLKSELFKIIFTRSVWNGFLGRVSLVLALFFEGRQHFFGPSSLPFGWFLLLWWFVLRCFFDCAI